MKKTKLLIGTLSTILCLSLASCDTRPYYEEADGFEASRDAFNECLEKTFNHQNMTISFAERGELNLKYTEKILGDTSYLAVEQHYAPSGEEINAIVSQTWCFVNEKGEKIVATQSSPWDNGAASIAHRYFFRGENDYNECYKSYIRYFDFVNKLEEWIEPFTSTSEGKEIYDKTDIYWEKYNYTVKNPNDEGDMFVYWALDHRGYGEEEIHAHIWGGVNHKTGLVFEAASSFNLPEGCGPWNGEIVGANFNMTYDDVKKIDIPDISGWEDMTDK